MKNILIGITSSIASYKIYELIRLYKKNGYEVKVVLTQNSLQFVSPLVLETLSNNKVYLEQFAPRDNVEHIELTKWADVFVVAPLSANTLSKFATGVADNLLTSIFCAYLGHKKPILLAPAMNTGMWENPIIQENLKKLEKIGCNIAHPESGFLACGDNGTGRLCDINLIYLNSLRAFYQNKGNNKKRILVTLGGTQEPVDSVRYITNSSSGKMGLALCNWAYFMGYNVKAVSTFEIEHKPYKTTIAKTAQQMLEVIQKQDFDYLIMASAVGDFRAKNISEYKISKEDITDDFSLQLVKNPDVVATIAQNKKEYQKIIGFCLSDKDLITCAQNKLKNKNLDYIVANDVKTALNTSKNKVTIISKSGKMVDVDIDTKENIARRILEVVCD